MHAPTRLLDPPAVAPCRAIDPAEHAREIPSRRSGPRVVALATMGVLALLLIGLQVDLVRLRRDLTHLEHDDAQARAELRSARADVEQAVVERDGAAVRSQAARADLGRAAQQAADVGLDATTMERTERDANRFLGELEDGRSSTQVRSEQLAADVVDAARCLNEGLRALSTASTWSQEDDTAPDAACRLL